MLLDTCTCDALSSATAWVSIIIVSIPSHTLQHLLQSHEAPSRLSCSVMNPPYSRLQDQTRSVKASLPRARRVVPSLARPFSTTLCQGRRE